MQHNFKPPLAEKLIRTARSLGATAAKAIDARAVCVEDALAAFCTPTSCEHYGLSLSCPPHVGGPPVFRRLLAACNHAIVYKLDVPTRCLFSDERRDIFRLLHEIGAGVERAAKEQGCPAAAAFAGGSCKALFCYNLETCRVIAGNGNCRYPDSARPSMSGFGVNVSRLMQSAGWPFEPADPAGGPQASPVSAVCGLVLFMDADVSSVARFGRYELEGTVPE